MRVQVLPDAAAVAEAAAGLIVTTARAHGQIALSGGSTPRRAYAQAAETLDDWRGAVLWYGDERCVGLDDERSNHRMVAEALLEPLAGDCRPRVERILGERGPDAAAADYEARLRAALGDRPQLDLALMGLGPDCHTASLFPGMAEVEEGGRLAVGVPVAGMEPAVPRVTLTLPVFNSARQVVFLVAGADKAEAVARVFGDAPDRACPAARVRPETGELLVLADESAAVRLSL